MTSNPMENEMTANPNVKPKTPGTSSAFVWEDPFLLEDQLLDDEHMIRDTARQYAQEKLLPRVIEAYREEKLPKGKLVVCAAFGAGLSWGHFLVRW